MDDAEWRQDEREKEKIISDLSVALQQYESYFLHEALKGGYYDSKKSIRGFLENDPNHYFQQTALYIKNSSFKQTIDDMYTYYTDYLEDKVTQQTPDKQTPNITTKPDIQSVEKEELVEILEKVPVYVPSLEKYVSEIISIRDDLISEYFIDKEIGSTLNTDEKKEYTEKARNVFLENNKKIKNDLKKVKKIQKYFYEKKII